MIKNQQQYRIARGELTGLRREITAATEQSYHEERSLNPSAETVARISALEIQIKIFEQVQTTNIPLLPTDSLQALPELLIAARIARGMSQKDLAEFMGMKMQQIQSYEAQRYQTATLGRLSRIAEALGVNVHQAGELAGSRILGQVDLTTISRFPIGEMYRRGWFGPYSGRLIEARLSAHQHLTEFFESAYGAPPRARRRYARTKGIPHEATISAWEARVMIRADAKPSVRPLRSDIADIHWLRSFVSLSAQRDGLKEIRRKLNEAGIVLIIEDAMPGTRVDGAALRTTKGRFVLAFSLQDPRAETFWIAFMHALSHLGLHIVPGIYDAVFDEVDAPPECDMEEEADVYAREAAIPSGAWSSCQSRYDWTRQTILGDARRLGVAPAIVTGHIRRMLGDVGLPNRLGANQDVREFLIE